MCATRQRAKSLAGHVPPSSWYQHIKLIEAADAFHDISVMPNVRNRHIVRNYISMAIESLERKGFMPSEAVAIKPAIPARCSHVVDRLVERRATYWNQ